MISLDDVLAIDGGLKYILQRFPEAEKCVRDHRAKFSMHDERTASASIKQIIGKNGKSAWIVTDFGNSMKGMNAIQLAQHLDGTDFKDALRDVANCYNIQKEEVKPGYNSWAAKPDEAEGHRGVGPMEYTEIALKVIFTDSAWRAMGGTAGQKLSDPKKAFLKAKEICQMYHLKQLAYYTSTKEGVTHKFEASDKYPIFYFDEGDWGKIYCPLAANKGNRFFYRGNKPQKFIHGLKQAQDFRRSMHQAKLDLAGNEKPDIKDPNATKSIEQDAAKLPYLIRMSGGSDALNMAAFDYRVIWQNSESEPFTKYDVQDCQKIADKVINLPDVDEPGLKMGHKIALADLTLCTAWLPESMTKEKSDDGKPKNKDFRDWLRISPENNPNKTNGRTEVKLLIENALPYQYWDEQFDYDKDGNIKFKFGRPIVIYKPNNLRMYNFLYRSGFALLKGQDDETTYIHKTDNVVKQIWLKDLKKHLVDFLEKIGANEDLRNSFFRSPQLSPNSLGFLPEIELDFKPFDKDSQYFFFENAAWKITSTGIEEIKNNTSGKYVWESTMLTLQNRYGRTEKPKVVEAAVKIATPTPDAEFDIVIQNTDCYIFRFMMQVARIYWQAELQDRLMFNYYYDTEAKKSRYFEDKLPEPELKAGPIWEEYKALKAKILQNRTAAEVAEYKEKYKFSLDGELLMQSERDEQRMHLLNKMYCIGYTLHGHKFSDRGWVVMAGDHKLSDSDESNGGSGKSIITNMLKQFLTYVPIKGKGDTLEKNDFVFENVTEHTRLVLVDDADPYMNFKMWYEPATSDWVINRKGKTPVTLKYKDSPKIWINSNFGDRHTMESDLRRKIYTSNSDYYHAKSDRYLEEKKPKDDFGIQLFDDFTEVEWNLMYNTAATCLQVYLAAPKQIDPPMNNVTRRNLLSDMGDAFLSWANVYFCEETNRLNEFIPKLEAVYDFDPKKQISTPTFRKKLKAWCKFMEYEYNPVEYLNSQGTIVRRPQNGTPGQTPVEMVYIRTKAVPVQAEIFSTPKNDTDAKVDF
jgi:hypothetical protein